MDVGAAVAASAAVAARAVGATVAAGAATVASVAVATVDATCKGVETSKAAGQQVLGQGHSPHSPQGML